MTDELHKSLVPIVTVENLERAEMIQAILERHGIAVFLAPNERIRVLGESSVSGQPFDVLVAKEDLDAALDVLQTRKTQEIPASASGLDITLFVCRRCGERTLVKKSEDPAPRRCPRCMQES